MVTSHPPATTGTPAQIYVIRHGEKPADLPPGKHAQPPSPPFGVDVDGNQNAHSLLPRGWQRSGALAVLFDPDYRARCKRGCAPRPRCIRPAYADPDKTQNHRTYQTIQGLSERLGVPIQSPLPEGQEPALAGAVLASGRRGGADLLGTSAHPRPRSGHPHARGRHYPLRVARRPVRRHLDLHC